MRTGRARLRDQASDWGYAAGWRLVRAMPEFVARGTFDGGAFYAALGGGPDLARVIGVRPSDVPDSLMRASLASYARYWREAFRLPSMDLEQVGKRIDENFYGAEYFDEALEAGRGAVAAVPHSGNWDMAGVWLVQHHGTFTAVAERLKPESLARRFIEYRETLGFEVVPLTGGERTPFEVCAERLRQNKFVCLMADRDLTRTGVQVDFFGEPTLMPAGPAKLAIATGARLLPSYIWYEGDACCVRIHAPLDTSSGDVRAITQALADQFTRDIATHPEDWHMLQPQWLADLSDERRARLAIKEDNS
jgi:KDO2-lipid IV(A) lauroyltransferase